MSVFTRSCTIRRGAASVALKIRVSDVFHAVTDPIKLSSLPTISACTVAWFVRNQPDILLTVYAYTFFYTCVDIF